jgi:hypothetical protein
MGIPFQGRYVPWLTAVRPAPIQGLSGALAPPFYSAMPKTFPEPYIQLFLLVDDRNTAFKDNNLWEKIL